MPDAQKRKTGRIGFGEAACLLWSFTEWPVTASARRLSWKYC